ncbi:hypothetical protein [Aeromicrobium sp. UC242_57]|uniref:hypothetical protein n=1 Tax=Aeromicrobium sp. UC242_57 TaxID=3374624 RepID=UPI0037A1345E
MAVDMHSASHGSWQDPDRWWIKAPIFHGHEVKVSRSDWLTELRDPTKAETFPPAHALLVARRLGQVDRSR